MDPKTNNYEITRISNEKFILIFKDITKEIDSQIFHIQDKIQKSTLKTKSGVMLKTNFCYTSKIVQAKQDFYEFLEEGEEQIALKELDNL